MWADIFFFGWCAHKTFFLYTNKRIWSGSTSEKNMHWMLVRPQSSESRNPFFQEKVRFVLLTRLRWKSLLKRSMLLILRRSSRRSSFSSGWCTYGNRTYRSDRWVKTIWMKNVQYGTTFPPFFMNDDEARLCIKVNWLVAPFPTVRRLSNGWKIVSFPLPKGKSLPMKLF